MSTQKANPPAVQSTGVIDMKLEVVMIPVADVDRAKRFYGGLGWRLDADFPIREDLRVVQMTPTGSACAIMFGKGLTNAAPGSVEGLMLVVDDAERARQSLIRRDVDASEVFHFDAGIRSWGDRGHVAGPHPERQSYGSFTSFKDPDGNRWLVQEVTTRRPGRVQPGPNDVANLTALLRETEEHHGPYEASAPKHHWSQWYGAYIVARQSGKTPDEAAKDAGVHMQAPR